jgi:hypothetical protein
MARGGARPGAGRPARKSANTSPPSSRARPRARGWRKSKAVAGRQGRAVADRPADPVCKKCPGPLGCSDCRDSCELIAVHGFGSLRVEERALTAEQEPVVVPPAKRAA